MTLTLCTPHHHPISINLMDTSRPWWRKSRMPTRKWMDLPMLRLELYSSYMTHPSWQTSHPSRDSTWSSCSRSSPFKTIQKSQYMSDQAKTCWAPRKTEKNTLTKPTEPKIYVSSKSRNKSSSSTTNKAQAPIKWMMHSDPNIGMWTILHDPKAPAAESTEGTEPIWSPYVMTAPPFKTIQWKKERNSPKTFPFKTISPARPKPCLSKGKTSYMDTRSMLFDEPKTHQTPPTSPPSITPEVPTHLDHHHAHPQHHIHPENHLWSPAQRTHSPKGRKRHQSEPAFIRPRDIDQGLSHGLSALLAETSPLATLQNTATGQGQHP